VSDSSKPVVWIVDDSRTEAAITRSALGATYEFEMFEDGSSVVERLAATRKLPDIILLDWVMPGMPGDQVCRFIREQPAMRDLPVILVTASRVETADIVEGLGKGATDYVARPFVPEELRARVQSAIRTRRAAVAAEVERERLATVNRLGRVLFDAGTDIPSILTELLSVLVERLCDGCSLLVLPGELPHVFVSRHRAEPDGASLAEISTVADPIVHSFESSADARNQLPPAYHSYIDRFGLRGLAILPFPILSPVQGVVTVTRDGNSEPFSPDDMSMIETCIEYAALAVQNGVRFETERTTRDQLKRILEQLPVGIVASDGDGRITLTNPAIQALIPNLEKATKLADVAELAEFSTPDGTPVDPAGWIDHHDLSITPTHKVASVATVPLYTSRGTDAGAVTVVQDVTAERAIAAEREQVSRFMQQLLGIVGHDLRNPLGAFVAGLDMLRMTSESRQSITPILSRLTSSVRRMTRIVDQLLDVTRASLGAGIEIQPSKVDLKPLIESVIEEVKSVQPAATVTVVCPDKIVGRWDPERLAQVVSNIASNAAHYGKPGAPIQIKAEQQDGTARIAIHNENRDKPIAQHVLATLFDPHRRGTEGHRNTAGLGLGLYIVKQIVEAHRGSVTAHSDPSGTVFTVLLPTS
jgi:sigma-B regulation protein RsbU (phosphoserine phosphatase)